jgi:hypothetical protein
VAYGLKGVKFTYGNGPQCNGVASSFNINIYCDPGIEFDYNPVVNLSDPCAPSVQIVSQYGCPAMSVDRILNYLQKFEPYFGVLFILVGIVLCFFSYQLIRPTVCIVGLLTSVAIVVIIFYIFAFKPSTEPRVIVYWIGAGALIGIVVGLFLT